MLHLPILVTVNLRVNFWVEHFTFLISYEGSFHYQKIFEDVFTGDVFGGRVLGMKQTLLTLCLIVLSLPTLGGRDASWWDKK